MSYEEFRASFALVQEREIEFFEIDMLRHVNNARYVSWSETVRSVYLADVIGEDIWGKRGMIIAKHELHYVLPVRYRDRVLVGGRISRVGTKSFDFETIVWLSRLDAAAFRSIATLVAYDYEAERSIAIPQRWRDAIAAFERVQPA